jgi:hypothetical protein
VAENDPALAAVGPVLVEQQPGGDAERGVVFEQAVGQVEGGVQPVVGEVESADVAAGPFRVVGVAVGGVDELEGCGFGESGVEGGFDVGEQPAGQGELLAADVEGFADGEDLLAVQAAPETGRFAGVDRHLHGGGHVRPGGRGCRGRSRSARR